MLLVTLLSVDGSTLTNGDSDSTQSGGDIDSNLGMGDGRASNMDTPGGICGNSAIAGGVAGVLLAVVALLILIVVVILIIFIVRWRNQRLKETNNQGMLL